MHMIGAQVSQLIAEVCLAMEFHADSEDVARTCHPHPDAVGGPAARRHGHRRMNDSITGLLLGYGRAPVGKRMPEPATAVTERLDGRQRMRRVAKGLGRGPEGTKETAPHSLTIAESRLASNFLDWQPALLEHEPGGLEAQVFNCLCR